MISLNKGLYIANLTNDPVLRQTTGGEAVADFRIAINAEKTTDKNTDATFIDVEAYGGLAKLCADKLSKGSMILLEAKLKTAKWNNGTMEKLYLRADKIQFLDFLKKDFQKKEPS